MVAAGTRVYVDVEIKTNPANTALEFADGCGALFAATCGARVQEFRLLRGSIFVRVELALDECLTGARLDAIRAKFQKAWNDAVPMAEG